MRVSFFISKDNFAHIYQRIAHTEVLFAHNYQQIAHTEVLFTHIYQQIAHTEVLFAHNYQQIAYTDEKNAVSDDVNHHIIIDLEYAQSNFS